MKGPPAARARRPLPHPETPPRPQSLARRPPACLKTCRAPPPPPPPPAPFPAASAAAVRCRAACGCGMREPGPGYAVLCQGETATRPAPPFLRGGPGCMGSSAVAGHAAPIRPGGRPLGWPAASPLARIPPMAARGGALGDPPWPPPSLPALLDLLPSFRIFRSPQLLASTDCRRCILSPTGLCSLPLCAPLLHRYLIGCISFNFRRRTAGLRALSWEFCSGALSCWAIFRSLPCAL